ncbi:F-box/LRR-repeat protein At5g02910 [Linum perenne]
MAAATTNERIKSSTENNDGRDRISELPDEIIHQILRRISSPAKAARTAVLSRRWRSVWSCYPAVQYRHSDFPRLTVEKTLKNFKKFVEASMESPKKLSCVCRMYLQVIFNDVEASNPTSIDHLKYCTVQSNSKVDKRALLEALFKVCRPNHLTLIHRHKNSERFFRGLLSLMQQKGDAHESLMWLNGLKDVKIITRYVDVEIEEEEEELMMGCSKCKTKNQLCLELTWG